MKEIRKFQIGECEIRKYLDLPEEWEITKIYHREWGWEVFAELEGKEE